MPALKQAEVCQSCGFITLLVFADGYIDRRPGQEHNRACTKRKPRPAGKEDLDKLVERRAVEVWDKAVDTGEVPTFESGYQGELP